MDAREIVNHDVDPETSQPQPASAPAGPETLGSAPAPAGLNRRSLGGPPNHPTANALRQNTALNAQQRQGNATVQRMVRGLKPGLLPVQREGPNGGGGGGAGGAGGTSGGGMSTSLVYGGQTLSNDSESCTAALDAIAQEKGVDGAETFVTGFNTMAAEQWTAASEAGMTPQTGGQHGAGPGIAGPLIMEDVNLQQALKPKLATALTDLKTRRDDLVATFERMALNVMAEMLTASETKLNQEAERYGITLTGEAPSKAMGDSTNTPGATDSGGPTFDFKETPDDTLLAAAAEELKPLRAKLDKLLDERKELVGRTGQQGDTGQGGAPNTSPPGEGGQEGEGRGASPEDLKELDRVNRELGTAQADFDELRRKQEAEFPILAAFTGQGQAGALGSIGKDAANAQGTVAPVIAEQLANITKVRAAIAADDVKIWALPTILEGTKGQLNMGSETLGGRLIDDWAADKKSSSDLINLAIGVIAIGLGLIAAIPTGGASLAVGAAAGTTAVISTWQALSALKDYQLAQAMNATDPDKAKVISAEDPSLLWLAMDIVGAILDVKAAVGIFKNISGAMRQVVVSGANAKVATAAEPLTELTQLKEACDAAKKPGLYERVMTQIGAAEDPAKIKAAIDDTYKSIAQETRQAAAKSSAALPPTMRGMAGAAVHGAGDEFEASMRTADWLLDHVQGQIPDIAKGWIKDGKVRQLSRANLIADFGHLPSHKTRDGVSGVFSYADDLIDDGYLSHGGFYDAVHGRVYLSAQSGEEMAEGLIHEAEHRLKHLAERTNASVGGMDMAEADLHAREALVGFESEVQATIAQRDFLILTFRTPGGARYSKQAEFATSDMIDLMNCDDAALMARVEGYYTQTMGANASRYAKPEGLENLNPITEGIFNDIATRYDSISPPPAAAGPTVGTGPPRAPGLPDDEVTKVRERPAGTGPSVDDEPTGVYKKPQQSGPGIDDEPTHVDGQPPGFDPDDEVTQVK